jgi:hypothetical protein
MMQVTSLFQSLHKSFLRMLPLALVVAFCQQPARPDFWSTKGAGEIQTVKLTRELPPVAARKGNTVKFLAEVPASSTPPEIVNVLRDKIRTLLLNSKTGSIQLVDGPADTTIKCIITGYEPKVLHPAERQVGVQHQQIVTWIGTIEASVQVLDAHDRPIDAANVKVHLENDFVTAEKEDNITSVTDKKASWRDKIASGIKIAKGGDKGDVASLAGGGKSMHDALAVDDKGARQPTDLEWRDALIEAMAVKVANRIVPVDEEFIAILPIDKEFAQIKELAKAGHWGDVQEQTDKMGPLQGVKEAYRQYTLGLSYEANAYSDASHPEQAPEQLNKASQYYADARKIQPGEREFLLAQIRVQDSIDHYLEIQHFQQNASAAPPAPVKTEVVQPVSQKSVDPAPKESADDNAALIEMSQANMSEPVMISFVQNSSNPRFDVSSTGLLQLVRGKVPQNVIQAVQKKMSPAKAATGAAGAQPAARKPVPPPK